MRFKNFQLTVDDRPFNLQDMQKVIATDMNKLPYGKEIYLIEKEIIEDRFLWIYCQFENDRIYGETVLDKEAETTFKNTRNKNHIELRKQLFVLYDTDTKLLYTNDLNKKAFIRAYISGILDNKIITIKNVYASLEDFQNAVQKIKRIKFARKYDIFANLEPDRIFDPKGSIFGLDIPDKYVLQIEYNNKPINTIKSALNKLKQKRDQGAFEDIILIGENDRGVEESFNFSTLIKNIEVSPYKNENDRYDKNEVKELLLKEVR